MIILSGFHCIVLWKKRVYPNMSQAAYPNEESFSSSSNFCLLLKKLVRNCDGDRKQSLSFKYPTLCSEVWREEDEIYRLDCKTFEKDLEIEQVVFSVYFFVMQICPWRYVWWFIWNRLVYRTLWCRVKRIIYVHDNNNDIYSLQILFHKKWFDTWSTWFH